MKITIELDHPNNEREIIDIINIHLYKGALTDIWEKCRGKIKHEELSEKEKKFAQEIIEMIPHEIF